jgi:hypothetical protein
MFDAGIAACPGSIEYNIQMNVGRCLPHIWGLLVGRFRDAGKPALPVRNASFSGKGCRCVQAIGSNVVS